MTLKHLIQLCILRKSVLIGTMLIFNVTVWSQIRIKEDFKDLKYRSIGPYRGGRSLAVCGHPDYPNTFYFGAVGGGVWKTENGGKTWKCVSDSTFKTSSVGAIQCSPKNANIIYAGTGESDIRGNISYGDGMYKSMDHGLTWSKIGLDQTYAISDIAVHPENSDIVYAAALGNVFKPTKDRGLYKSVDGGRSWKKILFQSDSAGCIQVLLDPKNPAILYASMWQVYRTPWSMSSGGKYSSLYKSEDEGKTWKLISKNEGMPKGLLGKIKISVSPVNTNLLFAMVENKNGGLFKSDDAGKTWTKATKEKAIQQRPWYFSGIYCHPKDKDIVFVLNVLYHKSTDGGETFKSAMAAHADNHDLWINPDNPDIMIMGNDGGGTVTYNGGLSWSEQDFPTGQFYHVNLDRQFPYRIYGAQQDNTSISISSRSFGWQIDKKEWYTCSWGESGYIAPHPYKPGVTFGGNYSGSIFRFDKNLNHSTEVNVYPEIGLGDGADSLKYRFQWTFPLFFSPFSSKERAILYTASQKVHRSYDEGLHWEEISPDLTRNEPDKQVASGGPISKDNTGVEVYNTIFTLAESPVAKGTLWAGTDDGRIQVSTDDGSTWKDVSPKDIKPGTQISIVEPSQFDKSTVYFAANRFKMGEFGPLVYRSNDLGKSWQKINHGLPANSVTRVVREDPSQKGLLFCGTETGIYISMDEGLNWQSFQQNLPNTPVHDLQIHPTEHDLVVATHGRGFWIMDNISILYGTNRFKNNKVVLSCRNAYNSGGGTYSHENMQTGVNAPCGVVIDYFLPELVKDEVRIKISRGMDSLTSYSSSRDKDFKPVLINNDFYQPEEYKPIGILSSGKGFNRFVWDMKSDDLIKIDGDGQVLWAASLSGPLHTPGDLKIELYIKDSLHAQSTCSILADPRFNVIETNEYEQKKILLDSVILYVNRTHKSINQIRKWRKQILEFNGKVIELGNHDTIVELGKKIMDTLNQIENVLVQNKAKNIQDLLNYPMKLNNRMAALISNIDAFRGEVPLQYFQVFRDLRSKIDAEFEKIEKLKNNEMKAYNLAAHGIKLDVLELNIK